MVLGFILLCSTVDVGQCKSMGAKFPTMESCVEVNQKMGEDMAARITNAKLAYHFCVNVDNGEDA